MFSKPYSTKNSLFKLHRNTKTRRSNFKILATISLPFLLSTCKVHSQPIVNDQTQDSQNIQTSKRNLNQVVETDPLDTGFEDLDYWELELQLAQEMVRLNKQKKFLEDNNELRQKLINSDSSLSDRSKLNTWQATEGVVDALIRSGVDQQKSKTVKRAASKSVEQRMLSAKYNRRGSPGAPVAASSTDYSKPQQMSPDVRLDEAGLRNEEPKAQPELPKISKAVMTIEKDDVDQKNIKESTDNNAVTKSNIIDKLKEILRQ